MPTAASSDPPIDRQRPAPTAAPSTASSSSSDDRRADACFDQWAAASGDESAGSTMLDDHLVELLAELAGG